MCVHVVIIVWNMQRSAGNKNNSIPTNNSAYIITNNISTWSHELASSFILGMRKKTLCEDLGGAAGEGSQELATWSFL